MPDYSTCLRPILTQDVVERLSVRRESINLHGKADRARSILMEEVQASLPDAIKTASVSFKTAFNSHDLLLKSLAKQLGLKLRPKHINLPRLLDELPQDSLTVIFFDHFDAIMDRKAEDLDDKFDFDFIASINQVRNKDHVSIVCCTRDIPSNHFFRGEKSPLDLTLVDIPPLDYEELEQAWTRYLSPTWMDWLHEQHHIFRTLNQASQEQEDVLQWMEWLTLKFSQQGNFETKLATWKKEYQKRYQLSTERKSYDRSQKLSKYKDHWLPHSNVAGFIKDIILFFKNLKK